MSVTYTPARNLAFFNLYAGNTVPFNDPGAAGYAAFDPDRIDAKYFLSIVQNELLILEQVACMGGGAIQVRNNTGSTIIPGPVRISGHYTVASTSTDTGNPVFLITLADATGAAPANALLLSQLTTATTGIAYLGGTFTSAIDTSASAVGNPVYLAVGGGLTLTGPSAADTIQQVVGRVQTTANPGVISGLVTAPTAVGTSYFQNASVTVPKGGTGLSSGTSGGIPGYTSTTTIASSALLTNHALMVGGGAGATPRTIGTFSGILVGNGSLVDPSVLATGGNGQYLGVALGSPAWQTLQIPGYNYVINGGMEVNQRSTTGSFSANLGITALTTDKYSIDRWKVAAGVTDVQCQRTDTVAAAESGLFARYYETFKKVTNTGKLVAYQIIEANNAFPINTGGENITIQCKIKASLTSANKKVRLGLIYFSGTADTLPASLISAQGVASTDPTLTGANLFYQTPLSIPSGASGTITGNALDCTTTTAWQNFAFTTVGNTLGKNLIVAVWSDDTMTAADTISISEVGLYQGQTVSNYLPLSFSQEKARSLPYYTIRGAGCFGCWASTTSAQLGIQFSVPMRNSSYGVTLTTTAPVVGDPGVADRTGTASAVSSISYNSANGCAIGINGFAGATLGHCAVGESDFIIFDNEL